MGLLDQEFLTVAEVAEILKLNQQTVRNWIDGGYLKAFHVGRRVRILARTWRSCSSGARSSRWPNKPSPRIRGAQAFWNGDIMPGPDAPPEGG